MINIIRVHKKDHKNKNSIFDRNKKSSTLLLHFLIGIMLLIQSFCISNVNAQAVADIAFQNSYWTDHNIISTSNTSTNNSIKNEVGPGEGAATLAVVLVNKARSDITAVKGYLKLPEGFKAIGVTTQDTRNNISNSEESVDSYNSIIKPGETFTLYFDMNVLKNAKVGSYNASLDLIYTKVLESGQIRVNDIAVPFRLTGKVVLDIIPENHHLMPGSSNTIKINIKNKGSASASGVIISLNEAEGRINSLSNSNSSSTTNGERTESIPLVNIGNSTFNIGVIPPNKTAEITPLVYPSNSAGETVQNLVLQISYGDAYGNRKTSQESIGVVVSPKDPRSILNVEPQHTNNKNSSVLLTAGKIQEFNFTVANEGRRPVTDLLISVASGADTVKILGNSKWTFDRLMPQSKFNLSTNVFASKDVIGKPIEFPVKIQYVSDEQSTAETINLGSYVDGDITVRAYDLDINFIGNKPNLIGNLLNEGNTVALFTTVEMLKPPSSEKYLVQNFSPQQYLGDLTENSPLPFSIPLQIQNSTKAGTYPIFLKITYKDNLRIAHELIIKGSVDYEPIHQSENKGQSIFGIGIDINGNRNAYSMIAILTILVIVSIIVSIIVLRKRRSRSKLSRILGVDKNNTKKKEEQEDLDIGFLSDKPTDKEGNGIIDENKRR